jgi:hypothetical protein
MPSACDMDGLRCVGNPLITLVVLEVTGGRARMCCGLIPKEKENAMAWRNSLSVVGRKDRDGSSSAQVGVREALVAALPPLLMGLMVSLSLLIVTPSSRVVLGGPTQYPAWLRELTQPGAVSIPLRAAALVVPLVMGAALVGGGLLGAWRRLPRWSYTWATGAWVGVFHTVVLLAEDRPYLISPGVDAILLLALLALLLAAALVAARRGWIEAVLVGLGFSAPFALMVCFAATAGPFNRVDVALLAAPAGLGFAVLILAFLRGRRAVKWASLSLAAVLDAVLVWLYASAVSASGRWPLDDIRSFASIVLAVSVVGLLGPMIVSRLIAVRRPSVAA